jgi:rhamnogalacturonan endolyase
VAYLDGVHPSVVMCRGYYGRSVLAAWDYRDHKLKSRWVFDSSKPGLEKFSGQGNHNLSVADVDGDGKDEIIYGSMCVDDDGKGKYSTGMRHGDALYVGAFDPTRPGLQAWGIHEYPGIAPEDMPIWGAALYDARDGKVIFGKVPGEDVGRGVAADVDSSHLGAEFWCNLTGQLWDVHGNVIGRCPTTTSYVIWWDGDLLRELLGGNRITKWDPDFNYEWPIFTATGCYSINGSKNTPCLGADLFGDWREELVEPTDDGQKLRIFTTTTPTKHRIFTLMHDPEYRLAIAWQNVAYNQPPCTGFYLGEGMKFPVPRPNITLIGTKAAGLGQ